MTIEITDSALSSVDVLKAFQVPVTTIQKFKESGVLMTVTPYALKFANSEGHPLGSVMVKATAVKYAVAGKLTATSLAAVGTNLTKEIQQILNTLNSKSASAEVADSEPAKSAASIPADAPWLHNQKAKDSVIKILAEDETVEYTVKPTTKGDAVKANEFDQEAYDMADVEKKFAGFKAALGDTVDDVYKEPDSITEVKKMTKVPLNSATIQYQPVLGTSSGSTYYALALRDDLKVAVRVKANTVSIRAEGDMAKYKKALEAGGLDIKDSVYASMHVNCENPLMARRAIGASLMSMGIHFDTPMPDLKHVGAAA